MGGKLKKNPELKTTMDFVKEKIFFQLASDIQTIFQNGFQILNLHSQINKLNNSDFKIPCTIIGRIENVKLKKKI